MFKINTMENTDHNLQFLKEKILNIRSALCCIDCDAFSIRTHIIQTSDIDDEGNLYFRLIMPSIVTNDLKNFPVDLTYYRKSFSYYIKAKAIATILGNEHGFFEINENGKLQSITSNLAIKAKITEAEYKEYASEVPDIKKMAAKLKRNISDLSKKATLWF